MIFYNFLSELYYIIEKEIDITLKPIVRFMLPESYIDNIK